MKVVDMPPNVVTENLRKMKQSLNDLKETFDVLIEYNQISAKIIKSKYDAFINEGFTPDQALVLCKGL